MNFILVSFLFALLHNIVSSQLNSLLLNIDYNCDPVVQTALKVIFRYFDDQHFMTIVDLSSVHSLSAFTCTGGNNFRPLDVYNDLKSFKFGKDIEQNSISSFPTVHGYYVRCNLSDAQQNIFNPLKTHNPKTKLMIHAIDLNVDQAKDLLRNAYEKYNLLNVAGLFITPNFKNDVYVDSDVNLCLMNPFKADYELHGPAFKCIAFPLEDCDNELHEIDKFVKRRLKNLNGHKLKINIFDFPMVSKEEKGKFTYSDGELVRLMAEKMNFNTIYIVPLSGQPLYGYQLTNGTFVGSLAAMEYEKIDLVANARMIENYNTTKATFLQSIVSSKYVFFIQKRETRKELMISIYTRYDSTSKFIALITLTCLPFIYYAIFNLEVYMSGRFKKISLVKSFLYSVAFQCNISMAFVSFTSTRIIVVSSLFYAMIVTSLFQGTIIKNLNTGQKIGEIKSTEDLLNFDLKLLFPPTLASVLKEQSGDRLRTKLSNLAKTNAAIDLEDGIAQLKTDITVALLWTDMYSSNYLNRFFDNETGENYIETVPGVVFEFYVAPMVPKSSPFLENLNDIILRYVEYGFHFHHLRKAFADNEMIWIQRIKNGKTPHGRSLAISFKDIVASFKFLLILLTICFFVFFVELVFNHFKKNNF